MVSMMVGRDLSAFYQHTPREPDDTVLRVNDLRTPVHPKHELNFEVKAGEIVGVAGLVGAGRTEMLQTLFGVTPAVNGAIEMDGQTVTPQNPIEAIQAGIALALEDRKQQGIILEMAVRENMSLPSLRRDQKNGFLNRQKRRKSRRT